MNKLYIQKKVICLLLFTAILALSPLMQVGAGPSHTSQIRSIGSVARPPSSSPSFLLPLTGLGGDYTVHYCSQSPEVFVTEGITTKLSYWRDRGYTASRLVFQFKSGTEGSMGEVSILDYAKFDKSLEIFDNINVRVLPSAWDNIVFSDDFYNEWLRFTQYYLGDTRIAAFVIFNEVSSSTDGILGHTNFEVTQYFANLTRAIHQIDPDRVVIFPLGQLYYLNAQLWISDLNAIGIINEPNVVFDIVHPYFFENSNDLGMNPEQKASWYSSNWIMPCVEALGANRCWAGETFAWGEKTDDLQVRWITAIINEYVEYNVGFSIFNAFAYLKAPTSLGLNEQGMTASSYDAQ